MRNVIVAKRYAVSLSADISDSDLSDVLSSLNQFVKIYKESKDLRSLVSSPAFSDYEKNQVVSEILKKANITEIVSRLVGLLLERNRLSLIEKIRDYISEIIFQRKNIKLAEIVTPFKLNATELSDISYRLSKIESSKIELRQSLDRSLIAGIMIRIGNKVYNGSVRDRLEELKNNFL